MELTPSAIKAGILLARRLFANGIIHMDYINVPTTVFTPLEYGCVGMSEETAEKQFGKDNIEVEKKFLTKFKTFFTTKVYHIHFQPLEWALPHREDEACYTKLVTNKLDSERVVGIHYVGPNAAEQIQGLAIALKAGATKKHFDSTVGIHPSCAEE